MESFRVSFFSSFLFLLGWFFLLPKLPSTLNTNNTYNKQIRVNSNIKKIRNEHDIYICPISLFVIL